jgi:hypothetical protein
LAFSSLAKAEFAGGGDVSLDHDFVNHVWLVGVV